MDEGAHRAFVDLIYDAAVDSRLWIPAIEQLADLVGGVGGWLSQLNVATGAGEVKIARFDPTMMQRYWDHFSRSNPLSIVDDAGSYARNWDLRILTDDDWIPKEELVQGEYYADFLQPQDVHSVMMIRLGMRELDVSAFSITRPKRRGRFERTDIEAAERLHPHLIRALKIAERFGDTFAAEVAMAEALDHSSHGLFLVDRHGRVRHANTAAETMMRARTGLAVRNGYLRAPTAAASEKLQHLITAAHGLDGALAVAGSMALRMADRSLPLSVTVTPMRAERFSVFGSGQAAMVAVTNLEAQAPVQDSTLRELFGLTPAERRLAMTLLSGATLQEAAVEIGVSLNTVRDQLAKVFSKTGVSRQSQLVSLLLKTVGHFPLA